MLKLTSTCWNWNYQPAFPSTYRVWKRSITSDDGYIHRSIVPTEVIIV